MSSSGSTTAIMTQQHQSQVNAVQSNGGPKKGGISGSSSSGVPTPAATPVQNGTGGASGPSPPPFPKFGTVIPNRIFVGGISTNTTETELLELFSVFGHVKAARIIVDRAGVSKGYGFITFETENDTNQALAHNNVVLRERRLNIARAVKKQPFSRPTAAIPFDAHLPVDGRSSAPAAHPAGIPPHLPFYVAPPHHFFNPPFYTSAPLVGGAAAAAGQSAQVSQANHQDQQHTQPTTIYQGPPMFSAQAGPPQPSAAYASMLFPPMYIAQQYPAMVPCEYPYGVNANATTSNGTPHYIIGAPSGDTANGQRAPPACYAPPVPPEGVMYGAGPPPPFFHTANLEAMGLGGPLYATAAAGADGTFDPMALHGAVNHYGGGGGGGGTVPTFGLCEDGTFIDHPSASATPRSVLTSTPPAEQRATATPVVSLLSLEQQQEKDPAAMQGGRRPQQPPSQMSQSQSTSSSVNAVALSQPSRQYRGSTPNGNRRGGGGMGRQPLPPPQGAVAPNFNQNSQMQPSTGSYIFANRRQRKPQRRMPLPPLPPPQQQSQSQSQSSSAQHSSSQQSSTQNQHSACSEMGAGDAPISGKDNGLSEQMKTLNI